MSDDISRAMEAERLLAHPLLKEAFTTIQDEVTERWQNSPANDADGREKLWLSLKLLSRVRLHLESVVTNGQMAQATLREQAQSLAGRRPLPL